MPKNRVAAGVRLVVCVSTIFIAASAPSWAQSVGVFPDLNTGMSSRMDAAMRGGMPPVYFPAFPSTAPALPRAAGDMVSADILRNPLSQRILAKLEKAMKPAELGDHKQAIANLREMLVEQPKAAPYIHNLLGIEYASSHQPAQAVGAFEQTLRSMPHLSANHYNLGMSLLDVGQPERAEQELRKALELDPVSAKAKLALEALQRPPVR